jgi:hypothetical protein
LKVAALSQERGLVNGEPAVTAPGDAIPIEIPLDPASFWIVPRRWRVGDGKPQAFDGAEAFAGRGGDLAVKLGLRHGRELLKRVTDRGP